MKRPALLSRASPVLGDGLLEVLVLLAGDEADPLQGSEMFLSLRQVVGHEVRLTDVLVGATMAGIELQGALIVREGERELAALAVGVAEVVLDVGVARVAKSGRGKRPDRGVPVLGRDGCFPGRVLRVEPSLLRRRVGRVGAGRARQQGEAEAKQADGDLDADHITYLLASRCFASRSSGRSPSE